MLGCFPYTRCSPVHLSSQVKRALESGLKLWWEVLMLACEVEMSLDRFPPRGIRLKRRVELALEFGLELVPG